MSNGEGFSIRKRVESFGYAFRGVATLFASQHNMWIHAAATVAVLGLASFLGLGRYDWALLVMAISLVWAAEAVNSAIEWLCDVASSEHHPLVEKAKDVGAAAIGFLIMGPPLWAVLAG
jgi:diacylglycerol kinase (ATP)